MNSGQTSARLPWVALTLSFLSSGVGHIYCGQIVKGLFLYLSRLLLPLLCVVAAFAPPSNGVLLGLIIIPAAATVLIFLYSPIDALATAKRTGSEFELKEYNRASLYWLLIAMQLAYPMALTWGIREHLFEAYLIPTRSMSPTFLPGDRILVNKRTFHQKSPKRGDVVVFRTPSSERGRNWVKRVIGVAGDQIVIRGTQIEVNGKNVERERAPLDSTARNDNQAEGEVYYESHAGRRYRVLYSGESIDESAVDKIEVTVPDRSVFVLGDNRDRSRDSRHIGSIHVGDLIGDVDYNFFPAGSWSRFGVFQD